MLGAVETSSAKIWMQTGTAARMRVEYWADGARGPHAWTLPETTQAAREFALVQTLSRLRQATRYHYRLERDGQSVGPAQGYSFTTQSDWLYHGDPPPVKIALGSCVFLNDAAVDPPNTALGGDYNIFAAIADTHPQMMLWLGDNVYLRPADFFSRTAMSDRYRQARRLPELQNLLHQTANLAIWDDHDYGDNDSDRSYRMRGDSLDLFRAYWANPGYGLPEQAGVFHRFSWSDVELFMTDNRYSRAPNRLPDPDRDYFGPRQLQWLKDSLSNSTATFKLIAIGNQVLNTHSPSENYYSYQTEFKNLLAWLEKSRIPGVMILSGDRHHTEMFKLDRPGSYPLYDWTVSPLTSSPYVPFPPEQNLPDRVQDSLVIARNFGIIQVSGPAKARKLRLETHDAEGQVRWHFELGQQDLTPP